MFQRRIFEPDSSSDEDTAKRRASKRTQQPSTQEHLKFANSQNQRDVPSTTQARPQSAGAIIREKMRSQQKNALEGSRKTVANRILSKDNTVDNMVYSNTRYNTRSGVQTQERPGSATQKRSGIQTQERPGSATQKTVPQSQPQISDSDFLDRLAKSDVAAKSQTQTNSLYRDNTSRSGQQATRYQKAEPTTQESAYKNTTAADPRGQDPRFSKPVSRNEKQDKVIDQLINEPVREKVGPDKRIQNLAEKPILNVSQPAVQRQGYAPSQAVQDPPKRIEYQDQPSLTNQRRQEDRSANQAPGNEQKYQRPVNQDRAPNNQNQSQRPRSAQQERGHDQRSPRQRPAEQDRAPEQQSQHQRPAEQRDAQRQPQEQDHRQDRQYGQDRVQNQRASNQRPAEQEQRYQNQRPVGHRDADNARMDQDERPRSSYVGSYSGYVQKKQYQMEQEHLQDRERANFLKEEDPRRSSGNQQTSGNERYSQKQSSQQKDVDTRGPEEKPYTRMPISQKQDQVDGYGLDHSDKRYPQKQPQRSSNPHPNSEANLQKKRLDPALREHTRSPDETSPRKKYEHQQERIRPQTAKPNKSDMESGYREEKPLQHTQNRYEEKNEYSSKTRDTGNERRPNRRSNEQQEPRYQQRDRQDQKPRQTKEQYSSEEQDPEMFYEVQEEQKRKGILKKKHSPRQRMESDQQEKYNERDRPQRAREEPQRQKPDRRQEQDDYDSYDSEEEYRRQRREERRKRRQQEQEPEYAPERTQQRQRRQRSPSPESVESAEYQGPPRMSQQRRRSPPQRTTHERDHSPEPQPNTRPSNDLPTSSAQAPSIVKSLADLQTQVRDMLTQPVMKQSLMNWTITRKKKGFSSIYPKYYMTVSNAGTFLLAAKKKPLKYIISANEKNCKEKSSDYMGRVVNNMMGTVFRIYDKGIKPKKGANYRYIREELGVITYKSNIVGKKGPREMAILIPQVSGSGESVWWKPMDDSESMLSQHKEGNNMGISVFRNKQPVWNENLGAYVLNFNGRVEKASVKNFQLVDEFDKNKIYLQFGRVDKHVFSLDFIWPFTPLQAFSIALSSIDFKLACE